MRRFWTARKRAVIRELALIAVVFVAGIALQLWRGHGFGEAVERALPYLLGFATAGIVITLFVPSWFGESPIRNPRSDEMIPPIRSK